MKDKIRCVRYVDGEECGQIKNHGSHGGSGYTHDYLKPEVRKERAPMRHVGAATERFNASEEGIEYRAKAAAARGGPCKLATPVCTHVAEDLHERLTRGRSGGIAASLRDDPTEPVPACRACNTYVSTHPRWARDHGMLLSRKDVK